MAALTERKTSSGRVSGASFCCLPDNAGRKPVDLTKHGLDQFVERCGAMTRYVGTMLTWIALGRVGGRKPYCCVNRKTSNAQIWLSTHLLYGMLVLNGCGDQLEEMLGETLKDDVYIKWAYLVMIKTDDSMIVKTTLRFGYRGTPERDVMQEKGWRIDDLNDLAVEANWQRMLSTGDMDWWKMLHSRAMPQIGRVSATCVHWPVKGSCSRSRSASLSARCFFTSSRTSCPS